MNRYTNLQPKHGDVVFHCGHVEKGAHFSYSPDAVKAERPDGSVVQGHWIAECDQCLTERIKDGGDPAIRGDGLWQGDEPAIKTSPSMN